jgi:prepilin-type N-terminal cleavage/methylation domain-containing protein
MQAIRNSKGFTLVELMIAMLLSSIVIAAAFALFISSNRVYTASGLDSQVQQSVRAALDIMSNELAMAGFGTQDPQLVRDIQVVASREDEMPLTDSLINYDDRPDQLQIKASLGGMAIIVEEAALATLVGSGPGSGATIHERQGHDLLGDGMAVEVFDLERQRLGTGVLGEISTQPANRLSFASFVVAPDQAGLSALPVGAVVIQQPTYITYSVDSYGQLLRSTSNVRGTDAIVSSYVLARGVIDMQFSYLLGADSADPSLPVGWQPVVDSGVDMTNVENRRRVRAVRIDLLLRSEEPNPMMNADACNGGYAKTKYYLGDHEMDLGGMGCQYTIVQMSTVAHMPNLFSYNPEG